MGVYGVAIVAALLAIGSAGGISAPVLAASKPAIHDCASFQAWFGRQPGARLRLSAVPGGDTGPPPTRGSDQFPIAEVEETYFRGNVGGGGCIGGYYDASHHLAAIVLRYDTAQEYLETTVTSVPDGIRPGWVPVPTLNGAALGMSLHQVEAIEGSGKHVRSGHDLVLAYSWEKDDPQIGYSLKFLIVHDRVVAMDYIFGA